MDDSTTFDSIPAYALGALSNEERAAVEALLARSQAARDLLADYTAMLDGMALLASQTSARTAPSHLSDDFAKRLQRSEPIDLTKRPAQLPVRSYILRTLALVAAILVLLIGGVFAYQARQYQIEVDQIAAIKNDPTAQKTVLQFTDPNSTARVVYYRLSDQSNGVLEIAQMPPLPSGKQYQFWLIDSQSPKPYNTFSTESGAVMDLLIHKDDKTAAYQTVALTIEPSGGSPAPTTKPIAVGQF